MDAIGELGQREAEILQAVVLTHIRTAEAVGSRTVVKRCALEVSPATVRNVMADLEEAGYLEQLHTSSGRVPTVRGYRYYVDYLMVVPELTETEQQRIESEFAQRLTDAEDVLRQASHLLARTSRQAGLVEEPSEGEVRARRIELMPVSGDRVAVMVADNCGRVRTLMAAIDGRGEFDLLPKVSSLLNRHCADVALDELSGKMRMEADAATGEARTLADIAARLMEQLPLQRPGRLFLEGATQLFEQPEFHDVNRAREVFHLFDEPERLLDLLRVCLGAADEPRPTVVIGSEAPTAGTEDVGLVAAPYWVGDQIAGVLGVLGPRRMAYAHVVAIVDCTARALSRSLTRLAS